VESLALGDNLIFLISQPRSGSTLLQHMLAGHPRVETRPEPWMMLHLLYANRADGIATEYDAKTAYLALRTFLASLQAEGNHFLHSVRLSAGYLYEQALKESDADIFLDKTPRYYHIVDELREVFPRARIVFLFRNPVAVLSSILHTHAAGDWTSLRRSDRMHDLVTAPRRMVRAIDRLGEWRTAIVRYEELVDVPDQVLAALCSRLELDYVPDLKRYVASQAALGDPTAAQHDLPVPEYRDRWEQDLDTHAKRDVASSYLKELGPDLIRRMGYDSDQLLAKLAHRDHSRVGSRWKLLMTVDDELAWWRRVQLGVTHSRYQRGTTRTIIRLAYVFARGHAWRSGESRDHIESGPV
jgi:hypothetical protein